MFYPQEVGYSSVLYSRTSLLIHSKCNSLHLPPHTPHPSHSPPPTWQPQVCSPCLGALFAVAKTWKQPKCLSTDEWIKKMWYIYIMKYYTATKRKNNAICSNMDATCDSHTEQSQAERQVPNGPMYKTGPFLMWC